MFSFKINKKASATSVPVQISSAENSSSSKKAFHDDDDKDDEEPDFIQGLDGTNIVSKNNKKKIEKQVLVIPLINKNEWRIDKKIEDQNNEDITASKEENSDEKKEEQTGSLQDQAIKELLEEASTKTSSNKKNSKTIPILFQNRVPDGYEEDDNMDVSLRPDQSSVDDYERIPIEEFGLAMLRGMGWKEAEGIGLKNKKVVNMAEPKLRPKGMGLGAEATHLNKDVAPKNANTNNEEKEELTFKIGGFAMITRGSKKGYYGKIESFDEDNNRVILKLGISGKMEAVSKFYINLVPAAEYKKNSKVINSEKYEVYKAKQDEKEMERHRREERNGHRDSEEDEVSKSRKHKSDSSSDDEDYRSRRKTKKSDREEYDQEEKNDKRSGHDRDKESDRNSQRKSERDRDRRDDRDRDRHTSSSRHDDRRHEDRGDRNRNDDYYKSSSRNSDRRNDRERSKKDDDRDRRRRD